jgi:hypothetical protein
MVLCRAKIASQEHHHNGQKQNDANAIEDAQGKIANDERWIGEAPPL